MISFLAQLKKGLISENLQAGETPNWFAGWNQSNH